ncbi:NAD(P)-dependent oxidoreductase [Rhodococcus fascians]|nr:NAD(P)-dependent oxidoreductase [Rhodococcus fascians]
MHYVITGARGFLMSVLARTLLESRPDLTITAIDRDEPDEFTRAYFAAVDDRIAFARVDVTDRRALIHAVGDTAEVLVHGATVTHDPRSEAADPAKFADINIGGAVNVLDAARTKEIGTVVLVSSGAVYGRNRATTLHENTACEPDEMYGISKVTSEAIAHRYAELFGLAIPIVRPTKMFGPMERPSSGRAMMSLPYYLAAAALHNRPLAVTARTLSAGGDWLSAADTVDAIAGILDAQPTGSPVYNISSGVRTSVHGLADAFGVQLTTADDGFDMDPAHETGKNGVYINSRLTTDIGWTPRPLTAQVSAYMQWSHANPECFT